METRNSDAFPVLALIPLSRMSDTVPVSPTLLFVSNSLFISGINCLQKEVRLFGALEKVACCGMLHDSSV